MRKRKAFFSCTRGVAAIEFALLLPILILLLVGTAELSRFMIISQKLDKIANSMSDFVTQSSCVSRATLDSYVTAIPKIMAPNDFSGTVIFSSAAFFNNPTPPCTGSNVACITWQVKELGNDASSIGSSGSNASIPGGYPLIQGQNVIAAEVYYNYTPMILNISSLIPGLGAQKMQRNAVYKPRQGTLTALSASCS